MKIARHWKRAAMQIQLPNGKSMSVTAWGWSADSADEAQKRAEESVQRSAARIAAGQGFPAVTVTWIARDARRSSKR